MASRYEERLSRILAIVSARNSIRQADIVRDLHVSPRTAEDYCAELIRRGLLKKTGASEATRYERA
jgi:Mn-dependent DtxR family transcriptional regulator